MVPPPKIQQLAGAWIGPEEQTAYFRLDLDKTGRGLLVIQEDSPDGYFSYYKVSKTILADYKISFALLPLKGSDPTVTLTGEAYPRRLLLVRSGTNHGYKWHYKVSLEREDYLLPRIHAVKHASAQFHVQPEH